MVQYNLINTTTMPNMPNPEMYYTSQFLCGVQLCGAGASLTT